MFKKKSFVIIGPIRLYINEGNDNKSKKNGRKKIIQRIKNEGGLTMTGISNRTDYVIFPEIITDRERNNLQVKKIPLLHSKTIKFLKCSWLMECFKMNQSIPYNGFEINEFKTATTPLINNNDNEIKNNVGSNTYKNFYSGKCWMGFLDPFPTQNICQPKFYNILTGKKTNRPPEDYKSGLFGNKDITEDGYIDDGDVRMQDVKNTFEDLNYSKNFLKSYINNVNSMICNNNY